ncbi:MAG: hypothetical protein ACQERD_10505 [Campylobacterota bacterium]
MKILKILILLFSITFSNLLLADDDYDYDKYDEHKYNKKHHIYKNLDYLNLNNQQIKKLKKVLIKYQKEYREFYKKNKKEEKKLKELIVSSHFDKDEYEESLEEIYEEKIELETDFIESIHSILTPKQRERFSLHFKEWRVE